MLEGQRCLFKRPLPSACELHDADWSTHYRRDQRHLTAVPPSSATPVCTSDCFAKGKRPLLEHEDEEDGDQIQGDRVPRKSPKREEGGSSRGDGGGPGDMMTVDDNNSNDDNNNNNNNHHPDNSLIYTLGRDLSINCLLRLSRSDYGSIASLNHGFRSLVRGGELYRLRRLAGIVEHWVYFSCNVLEWDAFDPNRRRWMHLPSLPPNGCFMCSDKESLAVGTELLVFGMDVMSHVVLRYSILDNAWSQGVEMNCPRCLFGSASMGEIAIVAGGCSALGAVYGSAELYNSETRTWVTLPSMHKPRKMCSGVFMDRKFYVLGGVDESGKPLTCGEEFDLKTQTWRVIHNMFPAVLNRATGAPPLVAVVKDQLYSADYADKELRKYDKRNNKWITLGKLPERSVSVNGWGLAFRACGDRLIVIGGPRALAGGNIELNSWVPDDRPPQWDLIARKPSGSFVYNCAVMAC